MRIAGIIAEYNPFHSGHAWHIARTREAGYDYVIVCMGGHFTQRGEEAMLSKWDRARMALACGADAVFELPALFAVRTADAFARRSYRISTSKLQPSSPLLLRICSPSAEQVSPALLSSSCLRRVTISRR